MLIFELYGNQYKTCPGCSYETFEKFINNIRSMGINVSITDVEGTMYFSFNS